MIRRFAAVAAIALISCSASAAPEIGAEAPAFSGKTSSGETISLAQFAGQKVVLEWTNDQCPFVKKHYETGNMQATQTAANADGVVWLTVISSAPGHQGYVEPTQANTLTTERNASPDFVILDSSGEIGHAYGAKTTPHMFVIDETGVLRYDGAIDDKPSADHATINGATNYVLAALKNMTDGTEIEHARTKPYGCSVKYGS